MRAFFLYNKLVSISNLVQYDEVGQSPFLARYNRQKAVTISARLVGNYSLDEALKFFEDLIDKCCEPTKVPAKPVAQSKKSEKNL